MRNGTVRYGTAYDMVDMVGMVGMVGMGQFRKCGFTAFFIKL